MARIIHARLDGPTEQILVQIEKRLGWSDSQIVREGIKALHSLLPPRGRRKVVGMGRFESGIPDLGSTRKHLEGFGE
jgi:hypothetical protein